MVKLAFIYLLLLFHSYDQHQVTYLHTGEPHRNVSGVFGLVEWEPNSIPARRGDSFWRFCRCMFFNWMIWMRDFRFSPLKFLLSFSPLKDSGFWGDVGEANIRDKGMPKRLYAHMWGISEGSVDVWILTTNGGNDGYPWSRWWIWSMVKNKWTNKTC